MGLRGSCAFRLIVGKATGTGGARGQVGSGQGGGRGQMGGAMGGDMGQGGGARVLFALYMGRGGVYAAGRRV